MTLFSRKNIKIFSIIVILLIVVFSSVRGADNPVKGFLLGISSPFLKTSRIFSAGISGFFNFLGSIGKLKNENEKLLQDNQELLAENVRLKDVQKENQTLRKELDLVPKKDYELEASFVVGQDPQGLGNYFIIDKGENAGLKTGMPAIVSNGILVGKVSEVYGGTAKVTLVTDPESLINAEVENSGAKGIVRGEYGLGVKIDMISQTEVINEGDQVVTSGLGGGIPRGLTVGRVVRVSQSADKLFQEASVASAANFSNLRIIFIVKNF